MYCLFKRENKKKTLVRSREDRAAPKRKPKKPRQKQRREHRRLRRAEAEKK